ncbi:MAG: BamA/TamA family outer membrane protein [Armatimonadetes bacterium]|nr:BamA/TamA family outer membrane protein [Armatimonadota bacterium]
MLLLLAALVWLSPAARAAEADAATAGLVVKGVRFTGVTQLPEAKLREVLHTRPGQPFDAEALARDVQAVEALYRQAGYPLAHVAAGFGIDAEGVVTLPINEGRIEKVVVKGAKKTRHHVITRELESRAGQVYRREALADDRRRLYDLGFFESVSMVPSAGSEPGKAVLTVEVKERLTGNVAAAAGYASSAGLVGFVQLSDSNFLGTGQTISVNWQRGSYGTRTFLDDGTYLGGQMRSGLDVGWFSPWLFSRKFSAGLRYFDTGTQQFTYFDQDYEDDTLKFYEWRHGTWLTLARELGHGMTLGFLARRERVDYSLAPPEITAPAGESAAPTRVSSVRLSMARGPMNPFSEMQGIPRTGAYLELGQADANGQRQSYQKLGITSTHYLPLSKKDVLASRVQLGWSFGAVPFSELYGVGGAQTLRSYSWSRFLGTRMLVVNTEWRHQITSGLAATAFLDLGYAWPRGVTLNLGDLRPAVGLGLRVVTPFGPIRLDYAFGRDGGRAHLTTGDRF